MNEQEHGAGVGFALASAILEGDREQFETIHRLYGTTATLDSVAAAERLALHQVADLTTDLIFLLADQHHKDWSYRSGLICGRDRLASASPALRCARRYSRPQLQCHLRASITASISRKPTVAGGAGAGGHSQSRSRYRCRNLSRTTYPDTRVVSGPGGAARLAERPVVDRSLRQGSATLTASPAELIRRRHCVGGVRSEHASDRLVARHVPRNALGEALFRRTAICLSHDGPVTGTLPAEGPACGAFVLSHGHHSQLCSTAGPISFHCRASVRLAAG